MNLKQIDSSNPDLKKCKLLSNKKWNALQLSANVLHLARSWENYSLLAYVYHQTRDRHFTWFNRLQGKDSTFKPRQTW